MEDTDVLGAMGFKTKKGFYGRGTPQCYEYLIGYPIEWTKTEHLETR
jgi:hypothetical protein